uniref:Uncharacterized protein n=1 Tax=Arundo donax TaxID=35708 RepID=A0A0A9E3Q3_ARUDO
MTVPGTKAAV